MEIKPPILKDISPIDTISEDIKRKNPPVSESFKPPSIKDLNSMGKDTRANTREFDISLNEVYTPLNSGDYTAKFPSFIQGTNNEERLARNQTSGEKWANGMTKLLGKTGTAILGGTIGTVDGIIQGISEGSLEAAYNSDFNKYLDDLNTKMDYKLPNYYTEQEKNMGLGGSLTTANFWANDVTSGLSFTLGTIVSEGIWAYATGGTSLIAKGALGSAARWGSKAMSTEKSLKALNTFKEVGGKAILRGAEKEAVDQIQKTAAKSLMGARLANNARTLVTSAGYEAGVEARHYMKSTEENWLNSFKEINGRPPSASERAKFMADLEDSANSVFASNTLLVGASNLAAFGGILNGKRIGRTLKNSAINNKLFGVGYETLEDGTKQALKATTGQKIARGAYTFGKYGVLEGVVEEGGQGVIKGTGEAYMLDTYNGKNIDNTIGLMDSMIKGFEEAYGTKEGQKEIGIGFIVGLFGGGIGGGFTEFSNQSEQFDAQAKYSNSVTQEIMFNRVKELSRIENAAKKEEQAILKGDLTGEVTARKEILHARAIRDIRLGGLRSGLKDLESYLEKTDNAEIAEIIGSENQSDIDAYKQQVYDDYRDVAEKTQRNLDYAEAVIGDSPIAGAKDYQVKELAEAMAYTLTMGEVSDEIADDMVTDIKSIVGERLGVEATEAITIENALRKVDSTSRQKMATLTRQKNLAQKKWDLLTKKLVKAQNVQNREDNSERDRRVSELSIQLNEQSEKLEELKTAQQLAFDTANIPTISNGQVTLDMLENQSSKLSSLNSRIENLKPQDRKIVKTLIKNYENAVRQTTMFNRTIDVLTNDRTRVNTLTGWLSSLVNKNKKLDEGIDTFFRESLEQYRTQQRSAVGSTLGQEQNQITVEETEEGPSPQPNNTVEKYERRIGEALSDKGYVKEYIGDNIDENLVLKKEDTDRFQELLEKTSVDPNLIISNIGSYNEGTGLTEEETTELKDLNKKLNDWKLLDGSGIGDMLKQLELLKTNITKDQTQSEVQVDELLLASNAKDSEGTKSSTTVNTVQSPSEKVAKLNDAGVYEISHTNIESLLDIVPDSKITLNGKELSKVSPYQRKKQGNRFVLETPDKTVNVVIGQYSRLEIDKEGLDSLLETSDFSILDTKVQNFMPLYKNGRPVEGDFQFENEDGAVVPYDANMTYDLQEGDMLTLEIDLNNSFNSQLKKDFDKDKITEQEFAQQVVIYTKPPSSPNKIVGQLRGISNNNSANSETVQLIKIREEAIGKLLSENKDKITLDAQVPVRKVLLGNPNLTVDENTRPETISFTKDSVSKVRATGFVQDGEFTINKDINYNPAVAKRFSGRNSQKGKKIPVVVFEYRGNNIAFPVSLVQRDSTLFDEAVNILDSQSSPSEKANLFTKLLMENKVDLKEYNLDFGDNWENQPEVDNLLRDLSNRKEVTDVDSWTNEEFSPVNLIQQAQIAVDITDRPLLPGKIVLELNEARNREQVSEQEEFEPVEEDMPELDENELYQITSLLSTVPVNTSEELLFELEKAFFKNGKFSPTLRSLDESPLYNQVEARRLMNDREKLEKVRGFIEQLKNTTETIENNSYIDDRYISVSAGTNAIGKLQESNPYDNQRKALELLGGVKDRQTFEDILENSDLDFLKDSYERTKGGDRDLFIELSKFDRVPVKDENLEDKTDSGRDLIMETITEPSDGDLRVPIDFVLRSSAIVRGINPDVYQNVIDEVLDSMSDIGLDLSELKGKPFEEVQQLFQALADYIEFQDQQSVDNIIEEYDRLYGLGNPLTKVVLVDPEVRGNNNLIYLETESNEYELFENNSLVPVGDNVYISVEPKTPQEAFEEGNTVPQDVETVEEYKNYLTELGKTVEKGENYDPDTLQNLVIAKIESGEITRDKGVESLGSLYTNSVPNSEYLQTEFIGDFNKKSIAEKRKGSEEYRNFYSKFNMGGNGIVLNDNDPLTLVQMEPYMDEDIKNYLRITGQVLPEPYDGSINRQIKRGIIFDNPKILPIFTDNYIKANRNTVRSKTSMDFIRLPDGGVYEATGEIGAWTFYSQMDVNPNDIMQFKTDITQPELNIDPKDYEHLVETEPETTINQLYNETTEDIIDKDLNCE